MDIWIPVAIFCVCCLFLIILAYYLTHRSKKEIVMLRPQGEYYKEMLNEKWKDKLSNKRQATTKRPAPKPYADHGYMYGVGDSGSDGDGGGDGGGE